MNGKDIFLGLGYIDSRFIEEAEKEELHPVIHSWKRSLLIAALVAVMLMLVGCSVAYAQGWFTSYFAQNSDKPLSSGQVEYIERNEQVIGESQVQNEWTVELRSAINDGKKAIIIIGVSAPEGVSLEPRIENDYLLDNFQPGNGGLRAAGPDVIPVFTEPEGVYCNGTFHWEEDGDGLPNTKNYVIELEPCLDWCTADPFGPDAEYRIHIEDIVRQYDDEEYKQSLLDGKYKGQDAIMFEPEETERMWKFDTLVEGTWDFTVRFNESTQEVELLQEPVTVMGYAYREGPPLNEFLGSTVESYEPIKLTSFVLRPLGATITYECDVGCNFAIHDEDHIYAVMKDGSQVELEDYGGGGGNYQLLDAVTPIVIEEVDHILLPDGTKISMP